MYFHFIKLNGFYYTSLGYVKNLNHYPLLIVSKNESFEVVFHIVQTWKKKAIILEKNYKLRKKINLFCIYLTKSNIYPNLKPGKKISKVSLGSNKCGDQNRSGGHRFFLNLTKRGSK